MNFNEKLILNSSGLYHVPCFHPLDAWQCSNGDVVFTDNLARNDVIRRLSLPCGRR